MERENKTKQTNKPHTHTHKNANDTWTRQLRPNLTNALPRQLYVKKTMQLMAKAEVTNVTSSGYCLVWQTYDMWAGSTEHHSMNVSQSQTSLRNTCVNSANEGLSHTCPFSVITWHFVSPPTAPTSPFSHPTLCVCVCVWITLLFGPQH